MGSNRSTSTSSSSSSDSDYNYKRNKKQSKRYKRKSRTTASTNSRTPPRPTTLEVEARDEARSSFIESRATTSSDSRIERLERLVERLVEERPIAPTYLPQPVRALPLRADCIPEFAPGNPNLSSFKWIQKIEQLALVHQWDQKTMVFNMQSRLTGLARKWYDNLSSYQKTWDEWKALILKTFPEHRDFASLLRSLVNRFKLPTETWEQYYFNKLDLVNACDITEKKAVSCLIDGITDPTIQAGARAGRFNTPDELYAEYISALRSEGSNSALQASNSNRDTYLNHRRGTKRPFENQRYGSNDQKKMKNDLNSKIVPPRCYNCKDKGHFSNNCTKPRIECTACKRLGHLAKDCRRKVRNQVVEPEGQIDLNKNYFFDCLVNGKPSKSYVDSGCGAVLIRKADSETLNIEYAPCNNLSISGYGGSEIHALGEAEVSIKIDLIERRVRALIVPDDAQEVPVMIGQTFLNKPGVLTIVSGEKVRILSADDSLTDLLKLPEKKVPLWAKSTTVIPPRTSAMVAITTRGAIYDDVYIRGGPRPVPGKEHYLDECITTGEDGYVTIVNLSQNELEVSLNKVLARCVNCFEDKSLQNCLNVFSTHAKTVQLFTQNNLSLNPNLTESETKNIVHLVNEFRDCFAQSTMELGKTDVAKMSIHLMDNSPVVYRPYRLSYNERKVVRNIVDDLLKNEIVRESDSPYSSPILLVKKKNGEMRMCVDYRKLNSKTVKDKYPLPRVDEFLEKLKNCKYFTKLDLACGYHQIPMEEASIPQTAFTTPDGHFEYLRMPFGLCNAPAVFQRAVNKVLGNLRYGKAIAYMDDVLLPASTIEEGLQNLREVLNSFRKAGLTFRISKCQFFMEKVEYLGHEITKDGVKPGANKCEAVKSFPTPIDVHSVRQFLGLASYFRKYVKGFATIAKSLTYLTKKDVKFFWGDEQREAFKTLKEKLASRPLLAIFDPQLKTELHTDASKWGLAGILLQLQPDNNLKPVLYYSRQTSKQEQMYHSYELETMAVVDSMKHFRVYLIGIEFTVVTDCNAIRTTLNKRDIVPRVGRWWLSIQEYTFNVEYRPGHKMAHADALSRNPISVNIVNINEKDWILNAQMADERCRFIIETLRRPKQDKEDEEIKNNYCLKNNRLYKILPAGLKWLVPKSARRQILLHFHDGNGHLSQDKTLSAMSNLYWFPGMRRYAKKFISCCLPCLYNKQPGGKQPRPLHPI